MKVLFVRERTHKLDLMETAALKTFSQCGDVVTIATIKVGGVLNTISQIKELIKQLTKKINRFLLILYIIILIIKIFLKK